MMDGGKRGSGGKGGKKAAKQYTLDELLGKAEELMLTYQPELAEKFYKRALEMQPSSTDALDAYGSFLLEQDRFDEAKPLFLRSIELDPLGDAAKYMFMGQLCEGLEATQYYGKGIELMQAQLKSVQAQKPSKAKREQLLMLKQQISAAYCSIAEVFLTDACFEDQAEEECERALAAAISADPDNPEPLQTLASVRMSQKRPTEALEIMNKSYAKWRDVEHDFQPSMEFRHNAAKLFLEMEQHETAAEIWEIMIEEDDTVAEVYYFLGLAYKKSSPADSLECATKAKELLTLSKCDDALLIEQVNELLAEAQTLTANLPPEELDDNPGSDAEADSDSDDGSGDMEV